MNKEELKKLVKDSKYFPEEYLNDFNSDVDDVGDILLKQEEEKEILRKKIKDKSDNLGKNNIVHIRDLFDALTHVQKYEMYKIQFK